MKFTIDRFEGEFAILEDENRNIENILRSFLPIDAKEGDILIKQDNGNFIIDHIATKLRKEKMKKLLDGLMDN